MLRAAFKSLMGRKLRLLMSTFAIVLGVAFVVGSLVFSDTLSRSFTSLFSSSVGDVVVQPKGGQIGQGSFGTASIPASTLDKLEGVEGASRVDGMVQGAGIFLVGSDGKLVGGQAPTFGFNWSDAPSAGGTQGLVVLEGREPRASGEVVIDEFSAERAGYQIGEDVRMVSAGEQSQLTATLVGLAGYESGGSLNGATILSFDTATAQQLFNEGKNTFQQVWVSAEPGVSQKELAKAVEARVGSDVEVQTGDELIEETGSQLQEAIGFITNFLLVFAIISLVVGSYLIVNTFSILLAQRSRELALFRALGASRRQVRRSVLIEALVVGLVGSVLGVGVGLGLAQVLKALFATFGLDLSGQGLVVEPSTYLAAFAVGVPVTMLAAYFPARRSGKIAPIQALSDQIALPQATLTRRVIGGTALFLGGSALAWLGLFGDIENYPLVYLGVGLLFILLGVTAWAPMLARPFLILMQRIYRAVWGAVGNLAGQNGVRNPRRTAATASALMITLALATTMAVISDSTKSSIDKLVADSYVGDYVVNSPVRQAFSPQIADQMRALNGVDRVDSLSTQFVPEGKTGFLSIGTTDIADPATTLQLAQVDGTLAVGKGGALLSDGYAESRDLKVGDTLTIELPKGKKSWTVAGIFTTDNVLVESDVLVDRASYLAGGLPDDVSTLIVEVDSPSPPVYDALKRVVSDNPLVSVSSQSDLATQFREPIDQFVLMIYALLGLALIIGVLGIVNTLALSVIERTREVGLLRAIGLSRRQTRRMVRLEAVVISVLGALLGLAIGVPFGISILYALRDEGLDVISIPEGQLLIFLAAAAVFGILAAALPARRAARLDILQAIATE